MFRLFSLTFLGEYRGKAHPHESPKVMTIPLMILAVASIFAGFLGVPHEFHWIPNYLEEYLKPIIPLYTQFESVVPVISGHLAMGITTALAIGASLLAVVIFSSGKSLGFFVFENKFWVDELYQIIFVKPFQMISKFLASIFDPKIIDGSVFLLSRGLKSVSGLATLIQSGDVQWYLFLMVVGLAVVLSFLLRGVVI
jgi:NADH-quinone oxidoreductase subunit L